MFKSKMHVSTLNQIASQLDIGVGVLIGVGVGRYEVIHISSHDVCVIVSINEKLS